MNSGIRLKTTDGEPLNTATSTDNEKLLTAKMGTSPDEILVACDTDLAIDLECIAQDSI